MRRRGSLRSARAIHLRGTTYRSPLSRGRRRNGFALLAILALALSVTEASGQAPVTAQHGVVVAQEARAAEIGVEMLKRGGNAVDAAVATAFALAVTYPPAGNLGGGGYLRIHLARPHQDVAIDYRGTAPAATARDIFLDQNGEADPRKSRDSALGI